jgi:hypothetical protein
MFKIILYTCIFLAAACKPQLKTATHSGTEIKTLSSETWHCSMPYQVASDSLYKFVIAKNYSLAKELGFKSPNYSDSLLKAKFYDPNPMSLQDNFVKECQTYLIKKLGKELFCNNLYLTLNSYGIDKGNNLDRRYLTFYFMMPGIVSKKTNIWTGFNLEIAEFKFSLLCSGRDKANIILPENIPDCGNRLDCGYLITRDSAVQIAIANHFISDSSQYILRSDGMYWMLFVEEQKLNYTRSLKIHMQTGLFKEDHIKPSDDVMDK